MKKLLLIITAALLLAACTGPQPAGQEDTGAPEEVKSEQRDVFAMDTYMTITCYGDQCKEAADAAEKEIKRLDSLLSVGNAQSEISRINREGKGRLSGDSRVMVEKSLELYRSTDGAFDITIYPLMELWGFTTKQYKVPSAAEIKDVMKSVGSDRLSCDEGQLTLNEKQGIDLGGIAKGYTSDRLMEIFAAYKLQSGMVSLGGNVQLYGTKPDGSLWKCGIKDPHITDDHSSLLGVLEAKDCAVITSGAYERCFTGADGTTYHHIIDPSTGYSADRGLLSVTVVSPQGMLADGLSTACFVMGLEKASDYWRASKEPFELILMTKDDKVYITEGLDGRFKTEYPVQIISRNP